MRLIGTIRLQLAVGIVIAFTLSALASLSRPAVLATNIDGTDANSLCVSTLERRIDALVGFARGLEVNSEASPWHRLHQILLFGPCTREEQLYSGPRKRRILELLKQCQAATISAFVLHNGRISARKGTCCESHRDQFLNYLSLAEVPLTQALYADANRFVIKDLLSTSQHEAILAGDLSWTVGAYAFYVAHDVSWSNRFGEALSLTALTKHLLEHGSDACGGTHRLLALARLARRPNGPHVEAGLLTAVTRQLKQEITQLKVTQLASGAFVLPNDTHLSDDSEVAEVIFTGHSIEWLSYACDPRSLTDPWIVDAVASTVERLETWIQHDQIVTDTTHSTNVDRWGAFCHAISGLARWKLSVAQP